MDGRAKRPVIIFSDMGGIDIEEVAEQHRAPLAHALLEPRAVLGLHREGRRLEGGRHRKRPRSTHAHRAALARVFVERDMTLAEINPIGRLAMDGTFVALDSLRDMEQEARGTHGDLLKALGILDEDTRMAPAHRVRNRGREGERRRHARIAGNITEFGATSASSSARAAARSRSTRSARQGATRPTTARSAATPRWRRLRPWTKLSSPSRASTRSRW
ncbi:MAG: ATP-grasp domain-containing protein [Dehalococcoidia bacterium]